MATYYVSNTGSNTSPYDTWANAATLLQTALTAATADGDIIKIDKDHTGDNAIAADLTLTFAADVAVICVDKDNSDALATMGELAWIGNATTSRRIAIAGAHKCFVHGVTFRIAGSSAFELSTNITAAQQTILESVKFWLSGTAGSVLQLGSANSVQEMSTVLNNCTVKFNNAGQRILKRGGKMVINSLVLEGTSPTNLFSDGIAPGVVDVVASDLSIATGNLVGVMGNGGGYFDFVNCKLGSGVVPMAAQPYGIIAECEVNLYNCMAGDTHYGFAHYNPLGQTVVETGIYANDGAEYNTAATKYSWKITTTASANFYHPYVSPWIHKYHEGTVAITPYLEILRDGSTTAYQDDEVWGEFSYQGTTGFALGTIVNDRMTLLGTPANQAAGGATWTGGTTPWSGKLAPGSAITPAEIGNLSARVCVGEPSITVCVDPQIRT